MTRLMGSRRRKNTTTRRREKREERREKSEERRERREETREKTEDRPQEAARGPQMRPSQVLPEGPTLFYAIPPPGAWPRKGSAPRWAERREPIKDRRKKQMTEESREKIEERREISRQPDAKARSRKGGMA